LSFFKLHNKTIEHEAALSLFVEQHTDIAKIDHLSSMCTSQFGDNATAGQIRLHRTKCTGIIKNVLAPHFYDNLRSDIGDSKFSLLLDESTDISVTELLGKYLIFCVICIY